MYQTKITKPNNIHNAFYFWIGLCLLFLNKIRHAISGYTTPRNFPVTEFQKAIEYDLNTVVKWQKFLHDYSSGKSSLKDKTILELGPGADLGVGIITLMHGAKKYNALDINNLVQSVPKQFYQKLFDLIETIPDKKNNIDFLRSQLEQFNLGQNDQLNYICNDNFDLSVFNKEEIDLVVSQAAFEHFDDIGQTISSLSKIVSPGTVFIAEVDLKTHTRWIREQDPLNIYRYSNFIYNLFHFLGSPNRVRPYEYRNILEKNGWKNIQIMPLDALEQNYLVKIQPTLSNRFKDKANQMDYLSVVICAEKE